MDFSDFTSNVSILVVDDEESIREILEEFLTLRNFKVEAAADGIEALNILEKRSFDVIMLDIKMPIMDGIKVLRNIRDRGIDSVVIMMTAFGTVETATEAFKLGAFDYILKPFNSDMISNTIQKAIENQHLKMENFYLKATVSLFDVAHAVEDAINNDNLIRKLGSALLKESGATVVSFYLFDKLKSRFDHYNSFFSEGEHFEIGIINPEIVGKALRHNDDILLNENDVIDFFVEEPEKKIYSLMVTPLRRGQKLLGFIMFTSFQQKVVFNYAQKKFVKVFASYFSAAIENNQLYQDLMENFNQTIQSFAHAIEAKDKYTQGHSERVTMYAVALARELMMKDEEIDMIYKAGRLHDIGKIGLQHEKLNKPGKLTDEEYEMFKKHPVIGKKILKPIKFLKPVISLVYHHHERFDGKGYPDGLKGEEIPLGARILSIADTYDAMTSDRSYRKALPHQIAVDELHRCAGTQFDPDLIEPFISAIEKYRFKCKEMGLDCPE